MDLALVSVCPTRETSVRKVKRWKDFDLKKQRRNNFTIKTYSLKALSESHKFLELNLDDVVNS